MAAPARRISPTPTRNLPVHLRRIVHRPEDLQELLVCDAVRIERDLHDLRVPGRTGADFLVARVGHEASAVAGDGLEHARDLAEHPLDTPEASRPERRLLS